MHGLQALLQAVQEGEGKCTYCQAVHGCMQGPGSSKGGGVCPPFFKTIPLGPPPFKLPGSAPASYTSVLYYELLGADQV